MSPRRRNSWRAIRIAGTFGAVFAVLPAVIGESDGIWAAMHVGGGALALAMLIAAALLRPPRQRWVAGAGLTISIILISANLSGESVGTLAQTAGLMLLAVIFVMTVFGPPPADPAGAD